MPTLQPIDPRVPRLYIVTVLLLVVFGVTLTDAGGRPRVMIAVNAGRQQFPMSWCSPGQFVCVDRLCTGGPSFVASDDAVYEADRYHSGGEASDFGIRFPITGTKDPELYQVCFRLLLCGRLSANDVVPPSQTERYASNGQVRSSTFGLSFVSLAPPSLTFPGPVGTGIGVYLAHATGYRGNLRAESEIFGSLLRAAREKGLWIGNERAQSDSRAGYLRAGRFWRSIRRKH